MTAGVTGPVVGLAAIVGACAGSFVNVCALRWPADESVRAPRSRCPACSAALRWFETLPFLGYALAAGRCRRCRARISLQYPLAEALGALAWGWAAWRWGLQPETLRGAVFLTLLLGIALADLRTYVIPDQFTWGGACVGLALSLLPGGATAVQAVSGAVVGFGALWLAAVGGKVLFKRDALGGGDVKALAVAGAFLGPAGALLTLFAGAVAGVLVFGPVSVRTGRLVPFGAFLALGGALAYGWGEPIVAWYLGALLP